MIEGTLLTILEDVANHAELVKVTASTLGAKWFLERDLDIGDAVLVPTGVHSDVGETEKEDILDHLLAKIVVNAERLVFLPVRFDSCDKFTARVQIFPEWFLNDETSNTSGMVVVPLYMVRDGGEDTWGEGEVEESVCGIVLGFVFRLDTCEMFLELLETLVGIVLARYIRRDGGELVDLRLRLRVVRVLDVRGFTLLEVSVIHLGARIAYYMHALGQVSLSKECEECWERLYARRSSASGFSGMLSGPTFFLARSPDAPNTSRRVS